ncbi:MerR family transcriptional regulator [Pontibacter sp. JAM-7]|uniref:MerR family transcriptional regulator n=1 Tax=Pontibacter sp. JAM-7 TaxID=3366581 RepID=UPI003AF5F44A
MPETDQNNVAETTIPGKRYFTIGEVAGLCDLKAHVLRYWEKEFEQIAPVKRNNRRYYQRQDVILIRRIKSLLYEQGYTLTGAKQFLSGDHHQDDQTRYKQLLRQTIAELEELLTVTRRG